MDDLTVQSITRAVCRHGNDISIKFVTTRTDTAFVLKATETICPRCLDDLATVIQQPATYPQS
jgi:hypothetical protein